MTLYLVLVGGPIDGFKPYGPFPNYLAAEAYVNYLIEQDDSDVPWYITELIPPVTA